MGQPTAGQITELQSALAALLQSNAGITANFNPYDITTAPVGVTGFVSNLAYVDLGSNNYQVNFDLLLVAKSAHPSQIAVVVPRDASVRAHGQLAGKLSLTRTGPPLICPPVEAWWYRGGVAASINAP